MARKSRKNKNITYIESENAEISPLPEDNRLATAAYARLSLENSGHETDDSIKTQIMLVESFIKEQPDLKLVDTYVDNGVSGTTFDRPAFTRLMNDVKTGKIQCIVVKDLSRFGRDYLEMGYLVEQLFPLLNVRFIAVTDRYDSNNPGDRNSIVMPVKNMVNAMYAKDFSRKDAAFHAHCRETGKVMKKDMPYGYRFSEETNNFEIDPETEPYVRMVFAWTFAGVSRSEIANRMNLLNISSPGKLRYDKKNNWRSETVRYIQINPAYAGIHIMGKTEKRKCDGIDSHKVRREDWVRYEDSHEAYITKEDQKTLEERLIQNQKRRVEHLALRQNIRDRMPDLFSGKVFCADCGRRMRFMRVGHDRKRVDLSFRVYCCDYKHKKTECSNGNVQMNYLRMVVLDQIRALYKTACDTDKVIRLMQQQAETENGSGSEKKIRRLQIKYQETEKQLIKTYTEYTEKSIDSETYRTTISGILAEKEQIEKQLKQQRVQQEKTERFISEIRAFKKNIGDRIQSGEMDEALIRELVKKVTVRNNEEVTIEFTCADLFQNSIMDEWMKTEKEAAQA